MKTNYLEKIKITWKLYEKFNSTRKVGEILGLARRTVQQQLKDYREYIGEKITLEVLELKTETPEIKTSEIKSTKQLNLSLKDGVVIVFSDAHILPNQEHSVAAKALLKLCKELSPDILINNGDLMDFASISTHDKLGWEDRFSVKDEVEAGANFLRELMSATPNSKMVTLEANHDNRFNKFLAKHAPQFKGLKGFDFKDQLPEGWDYAISVFLNDNTVFLHEFNGGVHSAYNNTVKSGLNIVTGHTHQMEIKPFTDYRGTRYGIQTGTLATIKGNPLFNYTMGTPLNWISGFAVLTYKNGHLLCPELVTVSDAGAFFRGKII